jgi:hypothetical protein
LGRTIDIPVATVVAVGALAEAELLFNGLCEVDGGVEGGGVEAADDEEEGGTDLAYEVVEGRLSLGIGSFPGATFAPDVELVYRLV